MARLIYHASCSLDGFTADARGNVDFTTPDPEVSRFVNDSLRPIRTYLFGRRMYEVMRVWDAPERYSELPGYLRDYAAIWRAAHKVVYSRTLVDPLGPGTRLERRFDAPAIRELKAASAHDILVGGATLASHAFRAGLIDEVRLVVAPVLLGGGVRAFPDAVQRTLELTDEHRFDSGLVFLRYAVLG